MVWGAEKLLGRGIEMVEEGGRRRRRRDAKSRPAKEMMQLGVVQIKRLLFVLRLMIWGSPLHLVLVPKSPLIHSPIRCATMITNTTHSKVNVYDVKDLEKPIQERESALKFMTRSIGMMADGRGALSC